jgi:hypothetical protein
MPITDKVAAAKQIGEFLQAVISNGGFKLKYRITVDPPIAQNREWEHPEILVEFAGPDSALLLERGGELLRSFELLASEVLHLQGNEHEKIWFDCKNFRAMRIDELQLAARVAAAQVGGRASLIGSDRCRRANGGSYIWRFARKKICAPRAMVRAEDGRWWCIRETTRRLRQCGRNAGRFHSCKLHTLLHTLRGS